MKYLAQTISCFWEKVDKSGECWVWTGCTTGSGYGSFHAGLAHRVSWEIENGEIPDGLHVCHRCDNPKCVRPTHLFLGSRSANMRDALLKGRFAVRVSDALADQIRSEYAAGTVKQKQLASKYGLMQSHISRIVRHESRSIQARIPALVQKKGARPGIANAMAKLTPELVSDIRQQYGTGQFSQYDLASKFNISRAQIGRIVNGQRWASA